MKVKAFPGAVGAGVLVLSVGLVVGSRDVAAAPPEPPVTLSDLQGVTQNWDKKLPSAERFIVLSAFGGAAVRDNETGLVWETEPDVQFGAWDFALQQCVTKNVGGRMGWRLPSIAELASLVDRSVAPPGPALPPGHPFKNVTGNFYWSATTVAYETFRAYAVRFSDGVVPHVSKDVSDVPVYWCVRGGMQESVDFHANLTQGFHRKLTRVCESQYSYGFVGKSSGSSVLLA